MPDAPAPTRAKRAYRAMGQRPDGTWVRRDFMQLARAEAAAAKMARPRTEEYAGHEIEYPPLANVTVVRSAPIEWLYDEQEVGP